MPVRFPWAVATYASVVLGTAYLGSAVAGHFLHELGPIGTAASVILVIAMVVAAFAVLAWLRREAGSLAVVATSIVGGGSAAFYLCGATALQQSGLRLDMSLSWREAIVFVAASAVGLPLLAGIPLLPSQGESRVGSGTAPLPAASERAPGGYTESWQRYRLLRRAVWIGALTPFVGAFLALALDRWLPGAMLLAPVAITVGFITVIVAQFGLGSFSCPRCTQPFFYRTTRWLRYGNPFARRCLNCGLPKWAKDVSGSHAA